MASRAILSNFFEEQRTQNHPQAFWDCPTTFLEIAVYKWFRQVCRPAAKQATNGLDECVGRLQRRLGVVKACSRFYTCISSLLIKPELHSETRELST